MSNTELLTQNDKMEHHLNPEVVFLCIKMSHSKFDTYISFIYIGND